MLKGFLPLMNQVLKCSYTVLRPTAKVSGEKLGNPAILSGNILVNDQVGDRKEGSICFFAFFFFLPAVFLISSGL